MRVAIILTGQNGDVCAATAVFKYRTELWGPNHEIHWYVMSRFAQCLEQNPHVIVHRLEGDKTKYLELTHETAITLVREHYDQVYMPAPYMYPELVMKAPILLIPVAVFGFKHNVTWRPQVYLTDEEIAQARALMDTAPRKRRVFFETFCNSCQSDWDDKLTCELGEKLKDCVLVAPSRAEHLRGLGLRNVFGLDSLNYRQLAEAYNRCDCYIGCSSGGAVVSMASRCLRHPRAEYVMAEKLTWSTKCITGADVFSDRPEFVEHCVQMVKGLNRHRQRPGVRRMRHEERRLVVREMA